MKTAQDVLEDNDQPQQSRPEPQDAVGPQSAQDAGTDSTQPANTAAQCAVEGDNAQKYKYTKARDGRGRGVDGLWLRNGRYYYQQSIPGKGCRRVALLDEQNQPVKSIQQAKVAIEDLRRKKRDGEIPQTRRAPFFNEYVEHYLAWVKATEAKRPKTQKMERSVLNRAAKHFGATRLTRITLRDINNYALMRMQSGPRPRAVNLDVLILGNLFRHAKKDGAFTGRLPTDGWEKLPYKPKPHVSIEKEDIDHFCAVALSKKQDGTPRFTNGEMLVDAVRLMAYCGARVKSAFALRWSDLNWTDRQLHLTRDTKRSKHIVVDFNDELEAHLKDMYSRRMPDTDAMFPGTRSDGGNSVGSLRKTFELVRLVAEIPHFKFHSLRHYFISAAARGGVDFLTIASWAGHSDTQLISRVYGHVNDLHKQVAAKKLDFGTRAEQPQPNAGTLIDVKKLTVAELLQLVQEKLQSENGQAQVAA